jgi:hypothetical protein
MYIVNCIQHYKFECFVLIILNTINRNITYVQLYQGYNYGYSFNQVVSNYRTGYQNKAKDIYHVFQMPQKLLCFHNRVQEMANIQKLDLTRRK